MAFTELQFQHPFWRYQQMILEVVERKSATQATYHIVAPPGSGKTIVGLELIRRFGQPAVVFAPTTTIQTQWQQKLSQFSDDPGWIADHSSVDARQLAEINLLTYQVLSTPGENLAFVERVAVERWVDDLLASDQAQTETDAHTRIETLRQTNPASFGREVSRRYRRVKRDFLRQAGTDGRAFLHPNARDLIDRIVALGVGTIVLDECHHLLDYWAFILRTLIAALPGVRVVGLTATLPNAATDQEYENYLALLGEVDFEVPTPAVVKEGNLAPYRDLVYFCEPSSRELRYLRQIQRHFEAAVQRVTQTPAFQTWLLETLVERGTRHAAEPESFDAFFSREPTLAVAGIKVLLLQGATLPPDVTVIEEMHQPPTIDDWLVLLETFGLRVLKVSADPDDQALYRELRRVLLGFGITITERGVRHQRSPGELVLTLSESKDAATVEILRAESAAMGERLRAVVITDFERMSAQGRRLKDVLDPDAGSAVRVFRRLVHDESTRGLSPVLVTGSVVLVGSDSIPRLEDGIRRWIGAAGATFSWSWEPTEDPRVSQLAGAGHGWGARAYVALVTDLFERGLAQCLVGTRGLFGEGWDALSLNTLIDLTAVTTSTGVQQLRGRSLRLDPAWPRKVAHNWDVVCTSTRFDKGDVDLRRFSARHHHTWGIIVRSGMADLANTVERASAGLLIGSPLQGQIVRGVAHVDIELADELAFRDFKMIQLQRVTQRMLSAVKQRERVYDLWKVGEPYSNFIYSATHLEPRDLKFRTVATISDSLRAIVRRLFGSLVGVAGTIWIAGLLQLPGFGDPTFLGFAVLVILVLGLLVTLAVNARAIWRVFKRAFLELPADAVLLDIARALLAALRETELVSHDLDDKYVRVAETPGGEYQVFVDYASPEDSDVFARAYRELLGPVGDARYLIERDSASLRNLIYRPLWSLVRASLGLGEDLRAYHRVPDVLATRRERAEALARAWKRTVGGGRLVYTRSSEGRLILLHARGQKRKPVRQLAFEFWK